MSSLWTPSGEHQPSGEGGQPAGGTGGPGGTPPGQVPPGPVQGSPDDPQLAEAEEQLRQVREELSQTPVQNIILQHAVGLAQLAVLHLDPEDTGVRNLEAARIAIDAVAALVGLGSDLGEHEEALRDILTQIQTAYVDVSGASGGDAD